MSSKQVLRHEKAIKKNKYRCTACGEHLTYSGSYPQGDPFLGDVDFVRCRNKKCGQMHQIIYVDELPILYTSSPRNWLWAAGERRVIA